MTAPKEPVSTFALMVDKLRKMDEAELKLAYIRLFKDEISAEWRELIEDMDLNEVTEEEITNAFSTQRYPTAQ